MNLLIGVCQLVGVPPAVFSMTWSRRRIGFSQRDRRLRAEESKDGLALQITPTVEHEVGLYRAERRLETLDGDACLLGKLADRRLLLGFTRFDATAGKLPPLLAG